MDFSIFQVIAVEFEPNFELFSGVIPPAETRKRRTTAEH